MLTHSGLILPDVPTVVFPGFFCLLFCGCLLSWVIFLQGSEKKLHNGERNELYSSPNIIRVIERGWDGRGMQHVRRRYRVLMGKPEGKRPLGRPRCRWEIIRRWISRKWDGWAWTG